MLQSVLQSFIPVLENAVMAVIPLAILLALMGKSKSEIIKKWIWRGILWGMIGALFIATVKLGSRAVKREVYEGLVLLVGLSSEVFLLALLSYQYRAGKVFVKEKALGILSFGVALALLLYHGLEFLLFPLNLLVSADSVFGLDILYKISGFFLAILLTWLIGLAVLRAGAALKREALLAVFTVQFLTLLLQQGILLIQVMMLRKFVPISRELMAVMAPLINHKVWFLYLLLAMTLVLPLTLLLQKKPDRPSGCNPAQYRKLLIGDRHQKRWAGAVVSSLAVLFLFSTVGMTYAEQQAELVPAVPVAAVQGQVQISLNEVDDGHLHRFSYQTASGSTVRFIIIKKSGSAYGVGLDACEICGPTGYFERDGQVVCKLCDVVMNTATIGFKGGCNPIPVEYKVTEGKVVIPQLVLEQEKDRFK